MTHAAIMELPRRSWQRFASFCSHTTGRDKFRACVVWETFWRELPRSNSVGYRKFMVCEWETVENLYHLRLLTRTHISQVITYSKDIFSVKRDISNCLNLLYCLVISGMTVLDVQLITAWTYVKCISKINSTHIHLEKVGVVTAFIFRFSCDLVRNVYTSTSFFKHTVEISEATVIKYMC